MLEIFLRKFEDFSGDIWFYLCVIQFHSICCLNYLYV